jgi:hypothetical protein
MVKKHTGAAVHLGDDHALGPVDDKSAVIGHQRHVAHIDGLFLDIADRLGAGILVQVPDDQAQDHFQRGGIGHAALDAFLDIVFRLFQLIIDEFKPAAAGEIVDREDRFEHFLNAGIGAGIGLDVHLQEGVVAGALHVDQVRHRGDFRDAPEAFANPLPAGERPFTQTIHRVHRITSLETDSLTYKNRRQAITKR